MSYNSFVDKIRVFFGINQSPPRNEFRNPIWSSDDEDEGDELYTRNNMDSFDNTVDLHREFAKHMQDMFTSFGSMFGDFKAFWNEDYTMDSFSSTHSLSPNNPETFNENTNSLREYYLKPGFQKRHEQPQDIDLDGKISSQEISGLLKQKKDKTSQSSGPLMPFDGSLIPGKSFCRTVITTSVTKPDGTIETRKIIKNGNEVIEETTTSTPDLREPQPVFDQISSPGIIYSHVMSELSSLFKNFY